MCFACKIRHSTLCTKIETGQISDQVEHWTNVNGPKADKVGILSYNSGTVKIFNQRVPRYISILIPEYRLLNFKCQNMNFNLTLQKCEGF